MKLPVVSKLEARPGDSATEQIAELLAAPGIRIEHIVSHGQPTPPGAWYEQSEAEWVLLVSGKAELRFDDEILHLVSGDHLLIPPGLRHRVEACSIDAVWLAVHFIELRD